MAGTPLWHDGNAADLVDPCWIVQRLPQPLEPPESPLNAILEKELRQLFEQMSSSGDVVFRFRAGPAPGSEHIECCDVLTDWTLGLVRKWAGDKEWRLRIERLVYKVLFEYIMKLQFGSNHALTDVGEHMNEHDKNAEEEPLQDMLVWLKGVATDPYGLRMSGMAQEWHTLWNMNMNYNNGQSVMQLCSNGLNLNKPPCEIRLQENVMFFHRMAICAREALFIKDVLSVEDFPCQTSRKQKIHHYLCGTSRVTATCPLDDVDSSLIYESYSDDGLASSCGMLKQPQRRSPRALALLKFGEFQRKYVPIGPAFQADVPEWKGPTCETEDLNDLRQSGTQIWPTKCDFEEAGLETAGKGRLNFCICPMPTSVACIRYHISKSRLQLKWHLGQAFNDLGFGDMGEEVSNSWTWDEQRIFDALVKLNPLSENRSFLEPASKVFGSKSRHDIVSFYFNVFILRRMGIQTRLIGEDANSDDDEFNVDAYEDMYPRASHKRLVRDTP